MPFWSIAFDRAVIVRAARIAFVVGTVLALINHSDRVFGGTADLVVLIKILVTYLVPYCVSTYSSVLAVRDKTQTLDPVEER